MVAALHQLLVFNFHLFHKFKIYFIIIIFSRVNDKLSRFYQYVYTSTVINYLAPIILSFSGVRACVELCLYIEARSWLQMANSYDSLIKYHQSLLEVAREVGDKAEEGRSYGNLGCAYQGLGQFKTAIEYH